MKTLSHSAKSTLLEMISRYRISHRAKDSPPSMDSSEKGELLLFIVTAGMIGLNYYIYAMTEIVNGLWGRFFAVELSLATVVFSFCLIFSGSFINVIKYGFNYFYKSICSFFYRVERSAKIRDSKSFENDLKLNYVELRDWLLQYSRAYSRASYLEHLIKEMKFPAKQTGELSVEHLLSILKETEKKVEVYSSNFVTFEELDALKAKPEDCDDNEENDVAVENIRFFEQNGKTK